MDYDDYLKFVENSKKDNLTFTYKEQGHKWELPFKLPYGYQKGFFYKIIGYKQPKEGELFLSGSKGYEEAFKAFNDMDDKFLVIEFI